MKIPQIEHKLSVAGQYLKIKEELEELKKEVVLGTKKTMIEESLDIIVATWNLIFLLESDMKNLRKHIKFTEDKLKNRSKKNSINSKYFIKIKKWFNL